MAIRFNDQILPFSLSFHGTHNYTSSVKEVWKDYRGEVDLLASIGENAPVDLHFYVDREVDWDEEAYIRIETSLYDENEVQESKIYPLQIKNSDKRHIHQMYIDSKRSGEYPWRLGRYGITVFYKGEYYTTYVNVMPLHLDSKEVQFIHNYLEKSIEGIIYDFIYGYKSKKQTDYGELAAYWYFDYSKFIHDHQEEIIYALLQIERNPSLDIVSRYQVSSILKKSGSKSVTWAMSGKGISKNHGIQPQIFFNNKEKHESNNTKENQWLKNILLQWLMDLKTVQMALQADYDRLLEDLDKEKQKLVNYQEQKSQLLGKKDVARHLKSHVSTVLRLTMENIEKNEHYQSLYISQLETLTLVKNRISHLITRSFLRDVPRGKMRPLLKARSYRLIDELYQESLKMKKAEGEKQRYIPILKQTWKVFEYFSLFKVLEILKEEGYELVEGIDQNFINIYNQEGIPEGSCFVLEKEDLVIHVFYDKYLAVSEKEATNRGEKFFVSLDNKRPDIKVDAYKKKEDGSLWFAGSFIFDAKYRRRSSIYGSDYLKSSHSQLQSYYSIFYFGDNRLNNNPLCVDDVFCLYTKDSRSSVKSYEFPITYIQLYPEIDEETEETIVVGQQQLQDGLKMWIDKKKILSKLY
ncbi:hypothetical protein COJ00_27020 [Priestia megaterium]|uniref:DUF2357 domain-containing protein n=1 Tax=Priestia megaterium TaxID=1404 RepID=UPI000BF4E9B0|nr:DUF2357 domain-containing protein [Priestia megaterium]PFJ40184.1 hypothetical protein COJ00_27020 [Priestia megaterium]